MRVAGQRAITAWSWISSLLLTGSVVTVVGFVLIKSLPVLHWRLIFGRAPPLEALWRWAPVTGGLWPAIGGTFFLVITAVGLALPFGLGAGIYLADCADGRLKRGLTLLFDVLAGVPSIVVGLFGFSLTIFLHRYLSARIYPSLLISALALAFLVLPYLIRGTQEALENLPNALRLIAPALGATRMQNIFRVLVPKALDGIAGGVLLSIGRCAEDTAVIMLTGAVASAGLPKSLLGSFEALPFYIYYISSQYRDPQELQQGYGAALILLLVCAVLLATSLILKNLLARRVRGW